MWRYKQEMNDQEYTVDALKHIRTGGRGPDGRIQYKHVSGGLQRPFYMVDHNRSRQMQTKQVHEEVVLKVFESFYRHPFLALVASGNVKRWIIATSTMKPGDIIRSHFEIPKIPIDPVPGDAYPIGALPVGTQICLIERVPGEGAVVCRSAGTSASIVMRGTRVGSEEAMLKEPIKDLNAVGRDVSIPDSEVCIVYEAGRKQEYRLLPQCMVVAGQVSNVEHKDYKYSNIHEKLNEGIKQRSGHYQKKTGRAGRKNRAAPPTLNMTTASEPLDMLLYNYSWPGQSKANNERKNQIFEELNRMTFDKIQPQPKEFNAEADHSQPKFNWAIWQRIR